MNFLAAQEGNYVTYIIVWAVILAVATASFIVVIHYARRFFTCHTITEIYNDGKKINKAVRYYKDGSLIETKKLKLAQKFPDIRPLTISSDSDIPQGSLDAFIMPYGDVRVIYGLAQPVKPASVRAQEGKCVIGLPPSLVEQSDETIRPVLLLCVDDVIGHLQETNSEIDYFPIWNRYKYTIIGDKEVLVLYAGEAIYGVVICSEAVFKAIIRIDDQYVTEKMSDIDSVSRLSSNGDVYSLVLDSTFRSLPRFFQILDRAYAYVLLSDFSKEGERYIYKAAAGDKSNTEILSFNEKISREFDPVYDRAIAEAKKYRAHLIAVMARERQLDRPVSVPRDLVYAELEKMDEKLNGQKNDTYQIPSYVDGPFVEEPVKPVEAPKKTEIPDINADLADLFPVVPCKLSIETLIDYIMAHKDMVSLTIDVSSDMRKTPTTMKFLSWFFALIVKGHAAYWINLKLSEDLMKELTKNHPNVIHVHNGSEMDWYRLTLDDTYKTYKELYLIILESYSYTKDSYYSAQKSLISSVPDEHRGII
jgi:predicted DNA-binding protein (MmcQ/YjbR family)